jgi:hypothetical protein
MYGRPSKCRVLIETVTKIDCKDEGKWLVMLSLTVGFGWSLEINPPGQHVVDSFRIVELDIDPHGCDETPYLPQAQGGLRLVFEKPTSASVCCPAR